MRILGSALLALATLMCNDLSFEPLRVPSVLVVIPQDTMVTVGDRIRYRIRVLDQDSVAMDVPADWESPEWSVENPDVARILDGGHLEPRSHAITQVRATFAGVRGQTRVRVNPGTLTVTAPVFYLTQGVQDYAGSVPLIAGRRALLRVFVIGDRGSFYQPRVLASFFHDDRLAHSALLELGAIGLPTEVDPGQLERSYNAEIPGWVLRPGAAMVIDVDPDGVLPGQPDGPLRIPEEGRHSLDVRELGGMELTVVPVLGPSDPAGRVLEWTADLSSDSDHVSLVRSLFPVSALDVGVREAFVTSSDLTKGAGWGELLGDLTYLRIQEGGTGYYYGAIALGEGALWEGLGYIGYPVAIGAADAGTLAHELGHNLNLHHAPCGGAAAPDPRFPYDGGAIGVWGYDFRENRVVNSFLYRDVMGYCHPAWISDYSFKRALLYRTEMEPTVLRRSALNPVGAADAGFGLERAAGAGLPGAGKTMLLMGRMTGGQLTLDPAFMVDLPAMLPTEPGPYRLTGLGPGGERRFSLSFQPRMTAYGGGHFLFAIPYDPAMDGALDEVVLSGPEGSVTLGRHSARPMAMITDPLSGALLGMLRDWDGSTPPGPPARLVRGNRVTVSEGLPGHETKW